MKIQGSPNTDEYLTSLWGYKRGVHLFDELKVVLPSDGKLSEDIAEDIFYQLFIVLDEKQQWPKLRPQKARDSIGLLNVKKAANFVKYFRHVEDILSSTHAIAGKFYRDHFMHMVRVMLLSHAIGNVLRLNDNELVSCTLAGLLHDIGLLPSELSSSSKLFGEMWKALREGYTYIDKTNPQWPKLDTKKLKNSEFWKDIIELINLPDDNLVSNHGVLGAFEFLSFFDAKKVKMNKYIMQVLFQVAQAIANHDVGIGTIISYSKDPISTILILSDEMQDWGRPTGALGKVIIPNIKSLQINKNKISASFDYLTCSECFPHPSFLQTEFEATASREEYFSPLLQICAKQKNLNRIILDGNFPELEIQFELPNYPVLLTRAEIQKVEETEKVWEAADDFVTSVDPSDRSLSYLLSDRQLQYYKYNKLLRSLHRHFKESTFPCFNLFINCKSNEFVISTQSEIPSRIFGYKNKEGKIQCNFRLTDLDKNYRIDFELERLKLWQDSGFAYRLVKEGEKTLQNFKHLLLRQDLTFREQAGCFTVFLQLLSFQELEFDLLHKISIITGLGRSKELEFAFPSESFYDFLRIHQHYNMFHFFLLEKEADSSLYIEIEN